MTDDLDRMLSGGAKSAFNKSSPIGTSVSGTVRSIVVRHATEYQTNAPLFFPSGDPKEQILVELQLDAGTYTPEDEDDDGVRTVYIKGWGQQRRAFQEAAKRDGKPGVGDRFTATFTGEGVNRQGGNNPKEFAYRIVKGKAPDTWATPGETSEAFAQAEKLLELGVLSPEQISKATGLPADVIAGMRRPEDTPF
jgi:hypothetical protein